MDDINVAAVREKSIRHGHPATLHLWWARRPLAAARAVIFAQMVNDPGYERSLGRGVNQEKAAIERERLFGIIRRLVQWENTTNETVLEEARKEIHKSWRETCELNRNHPQAADLFNPDKMPAFHDPFAGGGALPLEAQRLGLESYASDLNPVAVLINKAMIEIPPRFAGRAPVGAIPASEKQVKLTQDWSGAKGLAEDVHRYQKKQASQNLETARDTVTRVIRDAYKWVLAPMQEAKPGGGVSDIQWESFALNPGAQNMTADIERVLKENELLISEWAPIHLANLLKAWFWKPDVKETGALDVWQKSCCYLYLPRLLDGDVFTRALAAGAPSKDFFGFAYGKEDGKYVGFAYGKSTTPIMDASLLLVEPGAAAAFAGSIQEPVPSPAGGGDYAKAPAPGAAPVFTEPAPGGGEQPGAAKPSRKQFYGTIELDPIQAKKQFADIVEEVIMQFTAKPGVNVRIAIDIQAESAAGFDDGLQRVVKENSNVLKFKNAEFE